MTQFWFVIFVCEVCKSNFLFGTCPKFWAIFILKIYYFQRLLNIFYNKAHGHCNRNWFFWYFLESEKIFVLWRKRFLDLLKFMYFFYPKNNRTGSLKISITREWLAVESWAIFPWNAFSVLYRLVYTLYNVLSHLNEFILAWSA